MSELVFLLIFVPLSLLTAHKVAAPGDKWYLKLSVVVAWFFLAPLVAVVNSWMPYSGGGDDERYFEAAGFMVNVWTDLLDLSRFSSILEQPGYPWILSMISWSIGHDLLILKWLNLFFLISIAIIWYQIGLKLESILFARRLLLVILLLTPLWNYVFFLLKDMAIALTQSFFLLIAITIWQRARMSAVFGILITFLMLLLFRTPLIAQNMAVLIGGFFIKVFSRGAQGSRYLPLLLSVVLLAIGLVFFTNHENLVMLGIKSESRAISSEALLETATKYVEGESMNRSIFPILYLVSETSGMSMEAWSLMGSAWLRGVLALPWIFLLLPFFFVGLGQLFAIPKDIYPARGYLSRFRQTRLIATPWSVVVLFIASSAAISWVVGDTTRWRLADMPMIAAVALLGWQYGNAFWRKYMPLLPVIVLAFFCVNYLTGTYSSFFFMILTLIKDAVVESI